MPKSKVRKRNGAAVVRRTDRRAGLVQQRAMGVLVDDLEDLIGAVPADYDRGDFAAIVGHHKAATAVVAFLRTNRITDLLAALAGGDLVVMPGEDTAVDVQADGAAEVEIIQGEGTWGGALAAVAEAVPTTGGREYPWVWMTTRRKGLDYHEGDQAAGLAYGEGPWPVRTMCGRSTVSPTSAWLHREDAEPAHKRCPRCADALAQLDAPFNEVRSIDVREPGAALGERERHLLDTMGGPVEPIPTEILERIAAGLRRGTPTPGADISQVPLHPLTRVTKACTACGKVVRERKDGGVYAHKTLAGERCYG